MKNILKGFLCFILIIGISITLQQENVFAEEGLKIEIISPSKDFKGFIAGQDAKVTFKVTNGTKEKKKATLIVGLYDKYDRFINYVAGTQNIIPGEAEELSGAFRISPEGHKIKCFVWDTLDNMNPLTNIVEIPVLNGYNDESRIINIENISQLVHRGEEYLLPKMVYAEVTGPKVKEVKIEAGLTEKDRIVQVTLDTKEKRWYKVMVCGKELKYVYDKGIYIGVVGEDNETLIRNSITVIDYKHVPVMWSPTKADTTTVGKYTFVGTVEGYDKKVILNLEVYENGSNLEDEMVNIDNINEKVTLGQVYTMPKTVSAEMISKNCPKIKNFSIEAGLTAFDRIVEVKLEADNPENYRVVVCGKTLHYVSSKNIFQGVVASSDEDRIRKSIEVREVKQVPVKWEKETIIIDKMDKYTFEGTVEGYNKKVILTLEVLPKSN